MRENLILSQTRMNRCFTRLYVKAFTPNPSVKTSEYKDDYGGLEQTLISEYCKT